MKFNEKLIELRKKEGLSQEELGYKLNVTRQTISKWELGQTTPEMDKLVELSKIFNLSVDELINESDVTTNENPIMENDTYIEDKTVEDKEVEEKGNRSRTVFAIIVIALIVVIALIIIKMFTAVGTFNKVTDGSENVTGQAESLFERILNLFDKAIESQENMLENEDIDESINNILENDKISENINNILGNQGISKTKFNSTLEVYKGSNRGTSLKNFLDEVITINKKEDRKVIVKYLETETQDPEQIKNLKTRFEDSNNFEIYFDYDEEGYINKVTIERIISELERNQFNNVIEMYSGTKMGGHVISVLDKIITRNKTEERKITVKYNEIETQNEDEIKSIKRKVDTFDNYEVTLEYDADGFVNKAIIEKI